MNLFSKAEDFISKFEHIILTAHETPDGDAVGSECALYHALTYLGKDVHIYNADPVEDKYSYLNTAEIANTPGLDEEIDLDLSNFALIILDTNDINNIGHIKELILKRVREYLIIDHHESGDKILTETLIEEDASSTCEILYQLLLEMDIPLSKTIANALYTGIVYDTGSFIYPKTTARTFNIAEDLVSHGVEPNFIYSKIYESNSISTLILQSKVMSSIELKYDNQVAIQTMLKETILESNATYEEGTTFINIPLKCERIRVSIFFKENLEGVLRCSLRSKGNIDVSEIAQRYGGGGHKTAAGFKCKISLEKIKKKVLEELGVYFDKETSKK
jgi:bifunctional oligoribonuclease and PAP phosphatase NrnA